MIRMLSFISLIVLCSCGGPLRLDPEVRVHDRTQKAVATINKAAGRDVVVIGFSLIKVRGESLEEDCGQWTDPVIRIDEACDDAARGAVLVHEIGHVLGLADNDNPRSVMYKFATRMPLELAAKSLVEELDHCAHCW